MSSKAKKSSSSSKKDTAAAATHGDDATTATGADDNASQSMTLATTTTTTALQHTPSAHAPSVAGSVIEASDGLGGSTPLLIRIQNMASTANLGVPLDLKTIALKCRNTEYNPRRFAAVIMRLREPRATALLFASGKMVVTGVKTTHNAVLAAKKFAYIVSRIGFMPQDKIDFKVQNVTGTIDVGFPIRLEGLVYAHSAFASYEPELFPGLIYRLVSPRVVFLIFVSGKIVLTGAKKESDLATAMTKLYPVLLEFKKTQVAALSAVVTAGADNSSALAAAAAAEKKPSDGRQMEEV